MKYKRQHYLANKQKYIDKARAYELKNPPLGRRYVYNYLCTHPCVDCGETDPVVLEFDHITNKTTEVSKLARNRVKLEILIEEINKCVVRCANCHRRKTARDYNWYKSMRE